MIKKFVSKYIAGGGILIIAAFIANVFNFLFNAYLGRVTTFEQFGLITFLVSLWTLINIVLNSLGATVLNRVAFLEKNEGSKSASAFFSYFKQKALIVSIIAAVCWLLLTPLLISIFHISNYAPIVMFSPLILIGALTSIYRGFLQGQLFFVLVSLVLMSESVIRFLAALGFVSSGNTNLVYLSIPISIVITYFLSWYLAKSRILVSEEKHNHRFPRKFFSSVLIYSASTTAFLTIDIILVKHFFDPTNAGIYALLALIGKMIYFLGTATTSLIFTYASKGDADSYSVFNKLLLGSTLLTLLAFIVLGPFGHITTPILFGEKSKTLYPYLFVYTLAISCFTVCSTFITFHLARNEHRYTMIAFSMAILLAVALSVFHADLYQVIYSILTICVIGLITVVLHHIGRREQYAS